MANISFRVSVVLDKKVKKVENTFEVTNNIVRPAVERYGLEAKKVSVNLDEYSMEVKIEAEGTDEQVIKVTEDLAAFAVASEVEVQERTI
jgi:hypothetical protein